MSVVFAAILFPRQPSLRWYVNLLEEAVIKTCETFGVETHRTPDTGIWVGPNKICAMGKIECTVRYGIL